MKLKEFINKAVSVAMCAMIIGTTVVSVNVKADTKVSMEATDALDTHIDDGVAGILEKDVKNGKKQDVITKLYASLGVNPDLKPIKDTSALKAGLLGGDISLTRLDVGRIFDVLSGKAKQRKTLIDYETKYDKITKIKNYFGDDYFTNDLKIPKFKIRDFIDNALNNTENNIQLNDVNYFKLLQIFNSYSKIYLDFLYGNKPNNTKVIIKDTINN